VGPLSVPPGGPIYLDTNCIIYSVEHIAPYAGLLLPVWQGANAGRYLLVTSSITLLEVLVGPLRSGDGQLAVGYRQLLQHTTELRLVPISDLILERAAQIRATARLRTPDAIHAATALSEGCTLFLTNDPAFRRVASLTVAVLSEHVSP
jgi:predicted nucleic acid-binding protein